MSTYAITGIKAGVSPPKVPLRVEVDTWYPPQGKEYPTQTPEHEKQSILFFYALRYLQQRNPEDKLSYFQVAGEHTLLGFSTSEALI
jgi:tyrosinase